MEMNSRLINPGCSSFVSSIYNVEVGKVLEHKKQLVQLVEVYPVTDKTAQVVTTSIDTGETVTFQVRTKTTTRVGFAVYNMNNVRLGILAERRKRKEQAEVEQEEQPMNKQAQDELKAQVMQAVNKICSTETNCRGLANNAIPINALLALKGIDPDSVNVHEVPVNWNNQTVVLYQVKSTGEYRELFAGIGTDGNYYFADEHDEESDNWEDDTVPNQNAHHCTICHKPTDEQFLFRFSNTTKNEHGHNVTSHIHVCEWCQDEHSFFNLDDDNEREHYLYVKHNTMTYERDTNR